MSSPAPSPALSAPAAREPSPPLLEIFARSVLTLCLAMIVALTLVLALATTRPDAADDLFDRLQALLAAHTRPAPKADRMPPFCPSDAMSSRASQGAHRISSFVESLHSMDAEQLQYACEHQLENVRCVFVDAESAGEREPLVTGMSAGNGHASAQSGGAYGGSADSHRDASHGSAAHPVATLTDALRALAMHRVRTPASSSLLPARELVILRAGIYYVGATGGAFALPLEFENGLFEQFLQCAS